VSESEETLYYIKDISEFFGTLSGSGPQQVSGGILQQWSDSRAEGLAAAGALNKAGGVAQSPGVVGAQAAGLDITTRTLAKDRLLNQLASGYLQSGLKDTLSLEELALIGAKGEKVLLPINTRLLRTWNLVANIHSLVGVYVGSSTPDLHS
jgi:hypothetical protein